MTTTDPPITATKTLSRKEVVHISQHIKNVHSRRKFLSRLTKIYVTPPPQQPAQKLPTLDRLPSEHEAITAYANEIEKHLRWFLKRATPTSYQLIMKEHHREHCHLDIGSPCIFQGFSDQRKIKVSIEVS